MNKFFILVNIIIHFFVNPLFISYSYSNGEIKPLKIIKFNTNKYKFENLKKIKIPENFPTYTLNLREKCKTSDGKSWIDNTKLFVSENLFFGTKFNPKSTRIYIGTKNKKKIVFKIYEASSKWKNKEDYLRGYNIQLNNTSLGELINKVKMKGEYKSKNYKRTCNAIFTSKVSLNHFSDGSKKEKHHILNDQIWELKLARNQQEKAIKTMKNFGMHFGEKYDFESIYELTKKKVEEKKTIKLAKSNFNNNLQNPENIEISETKVNKIKNLNLKPLKTKPFNMGKFDYDTLEQVKVSGGFPKYRIASEESCQSNKGKKWKDTIIFFADENLIWAVKGYMSGLGVRIYMGTRRNDRIIFKVIEAHKKWDNMLNWIDGYSLDLKNKSFEDILNQTLKGDYASSGSYKRRCEIRFTNLVKTKDAYDHLININFVERRQKDALEIMDKFGIRFSQKYDFEKVKLAVKEIYEKEKKKLAEEKAKKLAEVKAIKLAEEKAKKLAEDKAKKEAEEKTRKIVEEKARKEAKEKAKKLAEEKAKKLAEEKAKKIAEEKAKNLAEEKAKKLAEEKAKKLAEEKAKKLAEEKANNLAEEKAKKLAEEKAKKEDEEKISKISEKFFETNITLINAHNIMEKIVKEKNIIKKDNEIKELNNLNIQLNKFFQKPIESYTHIEKKKYAQLQVEYSLILRGYYNNGIKSGEIPYPNEYSKSIKKYLIILLTKISNTNHLYEGEMILNDFKRKFSKSEWPEGIDQKIQKYRELLKTARLLIKESNSTDLWQKFIYPSNLYIKNVKLFKQDIKSWASASSEKFKSFYNKKLYDVSVQKNLNELKEKQKKEEDFFNKISN